MEAKNLNNEGKTAQNIFESAKIDENDSLRYKVIDKYYRDGRHTVEIGGILVKTEYNTFLFNRFVHSNSKT